jgi:hypothetical protein
VILELNERVRTGNICVKAIVFMGLAILFVAITSLSYGYISEFLWIRYNISVFPPEQFSLISMIFVIGVVFGYILREATI